MFAMFCTHLLSHNTAITLVFGIENEYTDRKQKIENEMSTNHVDAVPTINHTFSFTFYSLPCSC